MFNGFFCEIVFRVFFQEGLSFFFFDLKNFGNHASFFFKQSATKASTGKVVTTPAVNTVEGTKTLVTMSTVFVRKAAIQGTWDLHVERVRQFQWLEKKTISLTLFFLNGFN